MEHDDLTNDLQRRLRAARPHAAQIDSQAFDGALLERVRQQPIGIAPRSFAMPAAAGAIAVVTAAILLAGAPGTGGVPSSSAAIAQTLHWLDPPAGSVLHVRSIDTQGARTTTREYWQSADDPSRERELVEGDQTFETSGGAIYDPSNDTIYSGPGDSLAVDQPGVADPSKIGRAPIDPLPRGAGDPVVTKVRTLLQAGDMQVSGRELHDGVESWAVSLTPDAGRPVWTLWVSVADGKPVELEDPGRGDGDDAEVIRWPTYEVLEDGASAAALVTLTGAHPSARIVHDPAKVAAAEEQFFPSKP